MNRGTAAAAKNILLGTLSTNGFLKWPCCRRFVVVKNMSAGVVSWLGWHDAADAKMEPRWSLDEEVKAKRKSAEHKSKFRPQILEMHHQHSYTKLTIARFPMSLLVFLGVAIVLVNWNCKEVGGRWEKTIHAGETPDKVKNR